MIHWYTGTCSAFCIEMRGFCSTNYNRNVESQKLRKWSFEFLLPIQTLSTSCLSYSNFIRLNLFWSFPRPEESGDVVTESSLSESTTPGSTTPGPSTAEPTTPGPTTPDPTTHSPTTDPPTTHQPTTTDQPTTHRPTEPTSTSPPVTFPPGWVEM